MVQLELVDWEEIFQQIRVWCTFNPFIVYLSSSFTFFQQKVLHSLSIINPQTSAALNWFILTNMHRLLSYALLPLTTFSTCINTSCTTLVLTYFLGTIFASLGPSTSLLFMPPSSPSLFHYGNTFFNLPFVLGEPQWRLLLFKAVFTPPLFLPRKHASLWFSWPGIFFRPSAPSSTSSFIIKNYPSLYFDLQDL